MRKFAIQLIVFVEAGRLLRSEAFTAYQKFPTVPELSDSEEIISS
jgi:hypothetical protein